MLTLGRFQLSTHVLDRFRLDGGAMFGSVPKNLWAKRIPADSENCIAMVSRSLLVRAEGRAFLIDVGLGDKWSPETKKIFQIENLSTTNQGFENGEITDIILTHLHFDHAGGISRFEPDGTLALAYPEATVYLQESNFTNAKNPNLRERASYLKENVDILDTAKLTLLHGTTEIYPGIWVHRVDGHTVGQQWIEIRGDDRSVAFATDMIPTAHHLPIPYTMGYDICASTVLKEKETFLSKAFDNGWVVVFQHDAETAAATVTRDKKGHYAVRDKVSF